MFQIYDVNIGTVYILRWVKFLSVL